MLWPGPARPDVDLLRLAQLLQAHITPALCRAAFGRVRRTERQRAWTLTALVQFWVAVILRAPRALSHALADGLEQREPLFPPVPATPEAFFQRCRDLRPAFFAEVFERFTARVLPAVPPRYAAEMAAVQARFAAVVVFDGSRLAAIARRLKLLWGERAVVLPGCLLGVYDLGRGLCRALIFNPDAAASEFTRAVAALDRLPRDTLVLGDRLYCAAAFFEALQAHGCWGVVRRNKQLGLRKLQRLRRRRVQGGLLEDWLVRAGSGVSAPAQTLRYIRWRRGGTRYEVLTNVLTPARLKPGGVGPVPVPLGDGADVLRSQGSPELEPGLCGQPQRGGHAGLCRRHRVQRYARWPRVRPPRSWTGRPERIFPAKFFPKLAVACHLDLQEQQWARQFRHRHPHAHPQLIRSRRPWAHTTCTTIDVERRSEHRRRRRFCAARRHWKSLARVRGGRGFLAKLS